MFKKTLPRVLTISDMSGFGKCALTINIPVISACGAEVCPIPTAILSTNTKYSGFQLYDLTSFLDSYISHWQDISLTTDALYSGFLSSSEQVNIVKRCISVFNPSLTIIDPVMGDNGVLYKTITHEICEGIRHLVSMADIVTPNLTEAFILADDAFDDTNTSSDDIKALASKIRALGASQVIIKGVERDSKIFNCLLNDSGYFEFPFDLLPFKMFGTGDLFASVLTGKMICGKSIEYSINSASEFVSFIMKESLKYEDHERRGLCFEPYLYMLSDSYNPF